MDGGFLKIGTQDANAPQSDGMMAALRDGRLDVIRVDNVLSPQDCARIVAALESNAPEFETAEFPGPFRSFFYGRNLNLNEPELKDYFDAAYRFDTAVARLAGIVGVDAVGRVAACLAAMDGGRPYLPVPGPEGRSHFFTTFRGHHPGGYIPAHFDNEQNLRPSYRHVAQATDGDVFSFVVTLAEAEAGGMLEMFDLTASEGVTNDDRSARPDLSTLRSTCFPVPAGSMLIVRSGARLHRVTPVEGARMRWTMCSFMAVSRDGAATFCWG